MAAVFLSYVHEDKQAASRLAHALESKGLTVWWDRKILPGHQFQDVITSELASAQCVVVLWSKLSVKSDWVRDEATEGRDRGRLVPAFIEDVRPPFGFRQYQTANLMAWNGSLDATEFQTLFDAIARHCRSGRTEFPDVDSTAQAGSSRFGVESDAHIRDLLRRWTGVVDWVTLHIRSIVRAAFPSTKLALSFLALAVVATWIYLNADDALRAAAALKRIVTASVGGTSNSFGTLTLTSAVPCSVSIDGNPVTPLDSVGPMRSEIAAGDHIVNATCAHGRTWEKKIVIEPGKSVELSVALPERLTVVARTDCRHGGGKGASISADGRFILFVSFDSCDPSDTRYTERAVLFDRQTWTYKVLPLPSNASNTDVLDSTSMTADGRWAAYWMRGPVASLLDIVLINTANSSTTRLNVGQRYPWTNPSLLTHDATQVFFYTDSVKLNGRDNLNNYDAFVFDRNSGTSARLSIDVPPRAVDVSMSVSDLTPDGRYVVGLQVMTLGDRRMTRVIVFDAVAKRTEIASQSSESIYPNGRPRISSDGRYVLFASEVTNLINGEPNRRNHLFLRDRLSNQTRRISVMPHGNEIDMNVSEYDISGDGRFVAFSISNLGLSQKSVKDTLLFHDVQRGLTSTINIGRADQAKHAGGFSLSDDGLTLVFRGSSLLANHDHIAEDTYVVDLPVGQR